MVKRKVIAEVNKLIKLSDFVVKYLESVGVDTVFMVTGGGAMHLNDSFGQSNRIRIVFNHHEQACAMAAEGYSRASGKLGVANVTTGPGGLNALNGVLGQWTDSIPALYISGQVRYDTTVESLKGRLNLRQMGDQEVDIIEVVKPLTKYAEMVKDPYDIKWMLQKAIHLALSGRPGPVWLDIPQNVQSALIDESKLKDYEERAQDSRPITDLRSAAERTIKMIAEAKRPTIVVGHGVRIAKVTELVKELIKTLKVPALTTFNGLDILEDDFPFYAGRIGTIGQRAGNFTLQNSDLVLFLGTRNNVRQVSFRWELYARAAKKIAVDVDADELRKPTINYNLAIHADLHDFVPMLLKAAKEGPVEDHKEWCEWSQERRRRFPVVTPGQRSSALLNPYHFINELTKKLGPDTILVAGNGTACVAAFQSAEIKEGQRVFYNSGCASMGYDVPAAIGAACGSDKQIICLAGDGSFQMNMQELATIAYNQLPIKIFYLDNGGYASIRQTQDGFFGRRYGIGPGRGLLFPDTGKLTSAYGIAHFDIAEGVEMGKVIDSVLSTKGAAFCHVHLDPEHIFEPKLSSDKKPDGRLISKPLEDMYPFLPREVFKENMIIDVVRED